MDAVLAEVIGAYVGHDGRLRATDRDAAPQDPAARRLEHGGLDTRVAHHEPCARGTSVVPARHGHAADIHAVRAVVAGAPSLRPRTGRDESHGGCLTVGTRHDRRRDVPQVVPGHGRDSWQFIEREAAAARTRAQRQDRFVEHVRQAAGIRRSDQRTQERPCLASRQALQARQGAHASSSTGGSSTAPPVRRLHRRGHERFRQARPMQRVAVEQRRAQRPLVHFGCGE